MNSKFGIPDKILSLTLRTLLFVYNIVLLYLAVFQLKNDKMFVIAICIFGILCTTTYLIEGIWRTAKGKAPKVLDELVNGDGTNSEAAEDQAPFSSAIKMILFLALFYVSIRFFGLFLTTFVVMAVFPWVHSRHNIIISTLVSFVICLAFYYLYIVRLGVSAPEGIFFGF